MKIILILLISQKVTYFRIGWLVSYGNVMYFEVLLQSFIQNEHNGM